MPKGFDRSESSCVQDALLGTARVAVGEEETGGVVDTALAEVVEVAVVSALDGGVDVFW